MLKKKIPKVRCSKGSAAHFLSNSRHDKEIPVGGSKRSWKNVCCNQIKNVCWLLEL